MQTVEVQQVNIAAVAMWAFWGLIVLISIAASVFNIFRARSRRERIITFQSCVVVWMLLISAVVCIRYVEEPFNYIALGALVIIFPLVVYQAATRRQLLRILEEREKNLGKAQS